MCRLIQNVPELLRTSEISLAPSRGRILYAIYGNSTCVINHIVVTAIDKRYRNYYVSTPRGIKAAKLTKRRGQAKVVEWVTKEYSRGSRDIQVEVTPPKKKKAQRYSNGEKDNSKTALASHEDPLPSMNVDET